MKISIALAFCCFLPGLIFGQSADFQSKLTKGELISDDTYWTQVLALCNYTDGSVGALKKRFKKKNSDDPDYFIEQFDSNLKLISSNRIKTPDLACDESNLFSIHVVGDHFCVLWYASVKKTKTSALYYSVMTNDGTATEIKKLSEMKDEKDISKRWVGYRSLNDGTWIIKKIIKNEKSLITNFIFEYFDAALNLKWTQEYSPFKENETLTIGDFTFSKDGYMAMVVNNWNKKSKLDAGMRGVLVYFTGKLMKPRKDLHSKASF